VAIVGNKWVSQQRTRRRMMVDAWDEHGTFLVRISDADANLMLTAELTLTETMELREYISAQARRRVAAGRKQVSE